MFIVLMMCLVGMTFGSRLDLQQPSVHRHNVGITFQRVTSVKLITTHYHLIIPKLVPMLDPIPNLATYQCDEGTSMREILCESIVRIYRRLSDMYTQIVENLRDTETEVLNGFMRNIRLREHYENNTRVMRWIFRRRMATPARTARSANAIWHTSLATSHEYGAFMLESFSQSTLENFHSYEEFFNISLTGHTAITSLLTMRITVERMTSELLLQSINQLTSLISLTKEYERMRNAVLLAKSGVFSPDLVDTAELSRMFRQIRSELRQNSPGFFLTDSVSTFLLHPSFKISRDGYVLFIEIFLPLCTFPTASLFSLYKINKFPIAMSENETHATIIAQDYSYMLVSSQFWTLLKDKPYIKDDMLDMRLLTEPLKPIETVECLLAAFLNDREATLEMCEFDFVPYGLRPNAIRLADREILITNVSEYDVSCINESARHVQMNIAQAIIDLPCHCDLESKHFFIPKTFESCAPNSSFRDVKLISVVNNLPVLNSWFHHDKLASLMNLNSLLDYAVQINEQDLVPLKQWLHSMEIVGQKIRGNRYDLKQVTNVIHQHHEVAKNLSKLAAQNYEDAKRRDLEKQNMENANTEEESSWGDSFVDALKTIFVVPLTFFQWARGGFGLSGILGNGSWLTLAIAILGVLLGLKANCARGANVSMLVPPQFRLASAALSMARQANTFETTNRTIRSAELIINVSRYIPIETEFWQNDVIENLQQNATNISIIDSHIWLNQTTAEDTVGTMLIVLSTTIFFLAIVLGLFIFFVCILVNTIENRKNKIVIEMASANASIFITIATLPIAGENYKLIAMETCPTFKVDKGCLSYLHIRCQGFAAQHKTLKTLIYFPEKIRVSHRQAMQLIRILRGPFCFKVYLSRGHTLQRIKMHVRASAPAPTAESLIDIPNNDERYELLSYPSQQQNINPNFSETEM